MAASISGILTLLCLVGAGPVAWAAVLWRRRRAPDAAAGQSQDLDVSTAQHRADEREADEREAVSDGAYVMSLLGYAIGIGNLWRFPYLVGKHGGGAFVIAYLTCLFLVSLPAFFIEMVMGQYTRKSTINCFKMIHPRWTGLGYGQVALLFFALSYYNVLLVYAVVYTAGSLVTPLPWAADSVGYWQNTVLNNFGGDYEGQGLGPVQWRLAVGLLFVWVTVFLSLAFGKEVLAKVTWVTVVGPIVMLAILLSRVLFLEGAGDGIQFYIGKCDFAVLGDLSMWGVACGQILFSLSPGFGTAITMSSYTQPNQNVFRTCLVVALSNSAFSLVGGFAIFSILGNYTHRINSAGGIMDEATGVMVLTTVADQARSGAGLAFITIADGMQHFGSGSNIMSVLFFMTLFTLGLDSTFAWVETFVSCVEDFIEPYVERKPSRVKVVACCCAMFFMLGLFYCTRVGMELLDVVDHYVASYYLLFGVAVEATLFTVDFGWRRLVAHVKLSTLGNPETPGGQDIVASMLWRTVVPTTVPLMSSLLLFNLFYADVKEAYGGYPDWMQGLGWTLLVICIVIAPAFGGLAWWRKREGDLPPVEEDERRLSEALSERANGGPACSCERPETPEVSSRS